MQTSPKHVWEWVSLLSPEVSPASLRQMRSTQCHGWVSSPLARRKESHPATEPVTPQHTKYGNYAVKRQMNRVIYSTCLFMSKGHACLCVSVCLGGLNFSFLPSFLRCDSIRFTALMRTARRMQEVYFSLTLAESSRLNMKWQLSIIQFMLNINKVSWESKADAFISRFKQRHSKGVLNICDAVFIYFKM